jgi:hypothetical protein
MSRAMPGLRNLARRIIASEAKENGPSTRTGPPAFPVHEELYPYLERLIGREGIRALLSRALALANAELPWLRSIPGSADGALEEGAEPCTQLDPDKFFEGRVVVLAQLLGLLKAFIGESLTMRLVRNAWPKVSFNDLNVGEGDADEKAK